jgi:hypothetical protein
MRLKPALLLLLGLSVPASAQDRSVLGGFQLGLSFPTGSGDALYTDSGYGYIFKGTKFTSSVADFTDGSVAFLVGAHALYNIKNGHAVRVRLEYTQTSGTTRTKLGVPFDSSATTVGVMGDYLFHFTGRPVGPYALAGYGFEKTTVKVNNPYAGTTSNAKGAPAWNLGLGYQPNQVVGFELKYSSSHPDGMTYHGLPFMLKNDRWVASVDFSF